MENAVWERNPQAAWWGRMRGPEQRKVSKFMHTYSRVCWVFMLFLVSLL